MKNKIFLMLIPSFLLINFTFFILLGIGGASQAVVEGVAEPKWSAPIYQLWIWFLTPYLVYAAFLIKDWTILSLFPNSYNSIMRSAWLSFIGAIAVFFLIGSKVQHILIIIPLAQILITCLIYVFNLKVPKKP